MRLSTIASGSSGNCIYVGSDDTHVLIDAGISKKRIEIGLNSYDIELSNVSAILITHEHSDHISGLGVISRKYNIPIIGTPGTIEAIKSYTKLGYISEDLFVQINSDTDFFIGDLNIHPFSISHDANEPVAYRIENNGKSVAVATDMGKYDDYIINNLNKLDGIVIEANHDVNMLLAGIYPYYLKQRILGDRGHLSNESSGKLLDSILHDNIKYISLGHLSKENNYAQLAYETVKTEITLSNSKYKADDFQIVVANRDCCSPVFNI